MRNEKDCQLAKLEHKSKNNKILLLNDLPVCIVKYITAIKRMIHLDFSSNQANGSSNNRHNRFKTVFLRQVNIESYN